MDDLKRLQEYLVLDDDIASDDNLLPFLNQAAIEYIESTTGKKYDPENSLFELLNTLLVAHWYTNRTNETARSGAENSHSIKAIIHTIKHNADLKGVE